MALHSDHTNAEMLKQAYAAGSETNAAEYQEHVLAGRAPVRTTIDYTGVVERTTNGKSLNTITDEVYQWAKRKGWCDREVPVPEQIALIHSEASEGLECWRSKEPVSWTDEHGKPQGLGSEFADILIRLAHYAALDGIDLEYEYERKMAYNEKRPFRHGGKQG